MEGKKKIVIMAVPNPRAYSLTPEQLKELEEDKNSASHMERIRRNARLFEKLNIKNESGIEEYEPEL